MLQRQSGSGPMDRVPRAVARLLALWLAVACLPPASGDCSSWPVGKPALFGYQIVAEYPHDPTAFTQGGGRSGRARARRGRQQNAHPPLPELARACTRRSHAGAAARPRVPERRDGPAGHAKQRSPPRRARCRRRPPYQRPPRPAFNAPHRRAPWPPRRPRLRPQVRRGRRQLRGDLLRIDRWARAPPGAGGGSEPRAARLAEPETPEPGPARARPAPAAGPRSARARSARARRPATPPPPPGPPGQYGDSDVRIVSLPTGALRRRTPLADRWFGEGLAKIGSQLMQLTWQGPTGFTYSAADLAPTGSFTTPLRDGWGAAVDGNLLVLSDGSNVLTWVDPARGYARVKSVAVKAGGRPVANLNEARVGGPGPGAGRRQGPRGFAKRSSCSGPLGLRPPTLPARWKPPPDTPPHTHTLKTPQLEMVDGQVWANVWYTPCIARICPATGQVTGWILLNGLRENLLARNLPTYGRQIDVLNGGGRGEVWTYLGVRRRRRRRLQAATGCHAGAPPPAHCATPGSPIAQPRRSTPRHRV
jgi:glutamine cyclotransferase